MAILFPAKDVYRKADHDWVNTVGSTAHFALHHTVDHRPREAASLQQEGFDLRPPTDLYFSKLKPKIPQRTNNNLYGLPLHLISNLQYYPVQFSSSVFLSSHCSHLLSLCVFNSLGGFSVSSSQPFSNYFIFSYSFLFHVFSPFHFVCSAFMISLSMLIGQTHKKPLLQFSNSSRLSILLHLFSYLLHSTLIALSVFSTQGKLTLLSYPDLCKHIHLKVFSWFCLFSFFVQRGWHSLLW